MHQMSGATVILYPVSGANAYTPTLVGLDVIIHDRVIRRLGYVSEDYVRSLVVDGDISIDARTPGVLTTEALEIVNASDKPITVDVRY